ncbi:uncharacterized protein LOC132162251 [Corylus avellana]|uniref:uncharacterized protein LOC132162251 n=1 Tax=Corylus avellana TaxID=13451 RepID=UPI00286B2B65|nr:uncharacterized protein LOC132162251 [Corylus avellana]
MWDRDRRGLLCRPAHRYENVELELSVAWDPPDSEGTLPFVDSKGRSGGLALFWQNEAELEIQNYSRRHINATIPLGDGGKWKLTCFYGHPETSKREEAWSLLRYLATLGPEMWACMGDFNEILESSEKCGGGGRPRGTNGGFSEGVAARVTVERSTRSDRNPILLCLQKMPTGSYKKKRRFMYEATWAKEKTCSKLIKKEELRWRQRAKVDWIKHGDRNTKFFHAIANQRHQRNQVVHICDERGIICDTQESTEKAFWDFYSKLFTTEGTKGVKQCLRATQRRVTDDMNSSLLAEFTGEEVSRAVNLMAPLMALGLDGFTICFYQDNWTTVGVEVCNSVLPFLNSGIIDADLNYTYIALIPKTKNPTSVTEFRPISLYNVLYKIVSKVLTNRLKGILPEIISITQSAFIPGRLITDNILAAYETLHSMHTQMWGKEGFMVVKLDMSKAYDRVELNFLEKVMRRLGFADRWTNLIMACVRSINYSILVNGCPSGRIYPTRGIRQGDSLSPYLFILCAEALSSLLTRADQKGFLRGVPTSKKGPRLNHLFFADDSLLFCRTNVTNWRQLTKLLEKYEKASGQKLNRAKTSIFFSKNTSAANKQQIVEAFGIPTSQRYDSYLGLSALVGRSRTQAFQGIKDRIWKRLQDWKVKLLSQAGKEILLKAVIQAIPTYSMNVFLLPKCLCMEINSMMQRFWWGHQANDKKIHWMSWDRMSRSKASGGLGFRDLVCFNRALLAKQGWRLWSTPDSLTAKIMKAKYFPNGTYLEASLGSKPSYARRSIHSARVLVKEGLTWRIGSGTQVRIWGDKWIPRPHTFQIQFPPKMLPASATVSELIDRDLRWWNCPLINSIFNSEEARMIMSLPLSLTNQPDCQIWRGSANGEFTVKSAYHMVKEQEAIIKAESSARAGTNELWKVLWNLPLPNIEKVFMWQACNNLLPTKDNLLRRKVSNDPYCPMYENEAETTGHILCSGGRGGVSTGDGDRYYRNSPCRGRTNEEMEAPPQGFLKTNWDAALDLKKGTIEALALFHAVNFSKDLGIEKLMLEGDALNMVTGVKSNFFHMGRYGQIFKDIKSLLSTFLIWECHHVCRSGNRAAHELAKEACKQVVEKSWSFVIPRCIRDIVLTDQTELPIL